MPTRAALVFFRIAVLLPGMIFSSASFANGLQDLQQALTTLKQTSPFTAQIHASLTTQNTKDNKAPKKEGHTQFLLEKTDEGLLIHYPTGLLSKIEQESALKKQNPQTPTPTTDAMNRFKYDEFSILFNPVRDIDDDLRKATFIKEEAVTFQGNPARLLHLQIPLEKLHENERENLKKYNADIKIWINEKGVPLASHSIGKGSGRFALVIGFEFHFDVEKSYIMNGDRLLVNKLTSISSSNGAGMNESETIHADLTLVN